MRTPTRLDRLYLFFNLSNLLLLLVHLTRATKPVCPDECTCTAAVIRCTGTSLRPLEPLLDDRLHELSVDSCDQGVLDLSALVNATQLRRLRLTDCGVYAVRAAALGHLAHLDLSRNYLSSVDVRFLSQVPRLRAIDLSRNSLEALATSTDAWRRSRLVAVNLAHNRLTQFPSPPVSVARLDLSHNSISALPPPASDGGPASQLVTLDLSANLLGSVDPSFFNAFPRLRSLNLSANPIADIQAGAPFESLERLSLQATKLRYINLTAFPQVDHIDLSRNDKLQALFGSISVVTKTLNISNCALKTLPQDFLANADGTGISFAHNPWLCDECHTLWAGASVRSELCGNGSRLRNASNCAIGTTRRDDEIEALQYGSELSLSCDDFGQPAPSVVWRTYGTRQLIGEWNADLQKASTSADFADRVRLLPGGALLIPWLDRSTMGRYVCQASNAHGNASVVLRVHLDYSCWFWVKVHSVICSAATALAFFILNLIWIGVRKLLLWRLSRAERTSRVSKMLEFIEKYRQRQMDGLHEKYAAHMAQVRENYHAQVEQVRRSYAAQSERVRDYRDAQMESVATQLGQMRGNYAAHVTRLRDFGGRRMEQLGESYQRQVNRIRMFTLQQRLKLMRQYKVKQRYLNKLLESLNLEVRYSDATHDGSVASLADGLIVLPAWAEEPLSFTDDEDCDCDSRDDQPCTSRRARASQHDDLLSVTTYHSFASSDFRLDDFDASFPFADQFLEDEPPPPPAEDSAATTAEDGSTTTNNSTQSC